MSRNVINIGEIMKSIGIEAVNMYGCSLFLNQINLAKARGEDPEKVVTDFLIDTRSLNPPYEYAVLMGANAAKPLINDENKKEIGMLIVGTESSVDFGYLFSRNRDFLFAYFSIFLLYQSCLIAKMIIKRLEFHNSVFRFLTEMLR